MMKNNLKMFFLIMMIMSTMFLSSASSWLNMWIWLEINLIMFIAFMMNNNNKLTIESSLIYFLIQTVASTLLLFSIIMMIFFFKFMNLLMFSILMKLGSAPFHYWMPLMIEGMNWINIFLLLTLQKINPLIMLFYNYNNKFINMFILLSMTMGSISSLNYNSMKKIMSFSSINQLSWIMISLNINKLINLYIIFYFYLMWMNMYMMKLFNLNYINELFNLNNKKKMYKIFMFINFMSMAGLPPFLGFFPKMYIIMKINNLMMMMMIILFSMIMMFMYLRIMMSMLLLNSIKIMNMNNKNNNSNINKMMIKSIINNYMIMLLFFIY